MAKTKVKDDQKTQTLDFGADVSRLLDIVAHALYAKRDVFLRELISNASDACDRLRYQSIANPDLIKDDPALKIRIVTDSKARTLTITDNGIGMDRQELIDNLGTIAKSGTAKLMEEMSNTENQSDKMSLIGQFGVGFYASFMAADKVEVVSRKAGESDAFLWSSDGKTGFEIAEDGGNALMGERGTSITLFINDDASEYLLDDKLKDIILTYSDHINFPIYMGDLPGDDDNSDIQAVNSASALWTRPKNDIKDDEYDYFFKSLSHGMDDPLLTLHWKAEGVIEYTGLLFIPTMRPWDLYDPSRPHSVKLYVKRVFINDDCDGLVYPWLRFVKGVIDSEDLPLSISRETLQHNPVVAKIRNAMAKKVLGELSKLAEKDTPKFDAFWGQFGPVLKEGLYDALEHRDALLNVTRFYSTHEDGTLTSLADYVSRMKDGQDEIYYLSGEKLETLKNSPQIEGFQSRGIEVLFMTDTIDDFWLQNVPEYEGKKFVSVTRGQVDLSQFDDETTDKNEKDDQTETFDDKMTALAGRLGQILREELRDVRVSSRMTDSPVCLVAADNEVDLKMERVLKVTQGYNPTSKRILEINPKHNLIKRLKDVYESNSEDSLLSDAAHMLLDQALIIQGEPVPDPARFAKTMAKFMESGLKT